MKRRSFSFCDVYVTTGIFIKYLTHHLSLKMYNILFTLSSLLNGTSVSKDVVPDFVHQQAPTSGVVNNLTSIHHKYLTTKIIAVPALYLNTALSLMGIWRFRMHSGFLLLYVALFRSSDKFVFHIDGFWAFITNHLCQVVNYKEQTWRTSKLSWRASLCCSILALTGAALDHRDVCHSLDVAEISKGFKVDR